MTIAADRLQTENLTGQRESQDLFAAVFLQQYAFGNTGLNEIQRA